jgi:hypothetical protein
MDNVISSSKNLNQRKKSISEMMDALPGESNNRVDMDSNTNMLQMAGQDYLNANNTVISIQQNNDENDHEKTLVNPRTNGKFQKID